MFDFPASPALNDTYTSGGVTYKYNGYGWISTSNNTGPQGPQGPVGPTAGLTTVTAAFTTPAIGNTVVVSVNDASWMAVNLQLFIVDAYYNVNSIAGNSLTLQRTA